MFKKLSVLLSTLMVALLALTGCGSTTQTSQNNQSSSEKKKIVIGFSQCILDSPFYVALMDSAKATAKEMGAELVYVDAQNNIQKQNNDVMDLVSKGINVLILNPVDPDGVNPSLQAAAGKNIPVVTVDRAVNGKVTAAVGRDNKEMGRLMGEKAVALLGGKGNAKGKILEIQGAAGDKVMMARRDGFHSVVDNEKGIKVVQSPYCDYVRANAVKAAQDLVQANPDINLIYAHNDDMALGALQVVEQNPNMKGKVKVVGVDGLMEAVKAIKDGRYDATTLNDPGYLGKLAVQAAVDIANGKKVPEYIDGKTGVIDKSNVDQYLDDKKTFAEIK